MNGPKFGVASGSRSEIVPNIWSLNSLQAASIGLIWGC